MDLAQQLLDRIHAQNIRPVSRWRVRARRIGIQLLFGAVLLFGTLSVALALQEIHQHAGHGWLLRKTMSDYAPLVWTLTFGLMVWAGIRVFRELPRGWRVRPVHVGLVVAVVCLVAGWGVERSDALLVVHRVIAMRVPSYRAAWQAKALNQWHDPAAGRISGIWAAPGDSGALLAAVDGVRWTVVWEGSDSLTRIGAIRLLGKVCGPARFCADDWRPAPGHGMNFRGR